MASSEESRTQLEQSLFSKEQMDLLQKLINQQQPSGTSIIGTGFLAHKGNFLNALSASKEKINPWIVDSGASDHMTGDARNFHT